MGRRYVYEIFIEMLVDSVNKERERECERDEDEIYWEWR